MNRTQMRRPSLAIPVLILLGFVRFLPNAAGAQAPSHKSTVMVPMRDGTRLATDLYLPSGTGPWPAVLVRTPYDKNTYPTNPYVRVHPADLTPNGVAVVVQDVRGRGASEGGERPPYVDDGWGEHQDGADTVAWTRQQPWSNGKIAGTGRSSVGNPQFLLAGTGPEGIVGQVISVTPFSSYHHEFYRSGVFLKDAIESWLLGDGWSQNVLSLFRQHPSYDDLWRGLDLSTRREQVKWPIVHVGGWFDLYSQGTLDAFTQLQEYGGEGARGRQHLVIGPWTHVPLFSRVAGDLRFPANAAQPPGAPTELQWLLFWLTGNPAIPSDEPAVRYYVMGDVKDPQAPGNTWRTADSWPPPSQPLQLYFTADGGLETQPSTTTSTREYDYNPAKPVPTVRGDWYGPRDQRPVEARPDVLVFSTPLLTEPLEVTGRLSVRLYATTSARDTDFTAALTDVYPDGRSMYVADGVVRARYRLSLAQEAFVTPGQPYAYDIDLWSTSIIFNRGHRIRVSISSSNAPWLEPNLNTGGEWPFTNEKPVVAHQAITLGGPQASYITLPEVVGTGQP